MSERIKVPEGMLEAVGRQYERQGRVVDGTSGFSRIVEASLQWLSENPIEPTDEQIFEIAKALKLPGLPNNRGIEQFKGIVTEWQKCMFFAAESQGDDPIRDLLVNPVIGQVNGEQINDRLRKAFRRGQQSAKK